MSELGDDFRTMREARQPRKDAQRYMAGEDFNGVVRYAADANLVLRACDMVDQQERVAHYQLVSHDPDWLLNIYPGNCRLYWDPKHRGPFLKVNSPWCLRTIVAAAIRANRQHRRDRKRRQQRSVK